jgi:hypothetical protein
VTNGFWILLINFPSHHEKGVEGIIDYPSRHRNQQTADSLQICSGMRGEALIVCLSEFR